VGSAACKTCHPDKTSSFYRNPHFHAKLAGQDGDPLEDCESCHGSGAEHIKGPSKQNIFAFSTKEPAEIEKRCLACHSKTEYVEDISRSEHHRAGVACTTCHSIHAAATPRRLLKKKQSELCYTCHADVRAQFSMPFKHRVNEGVMECTDCHNPHGAASPTWKMGARPRMVALQSVNEEPCLRCHTDKRGPFVFEHPSVRVEGCEICHAVHGSPNPRMLKRPVVMTLCLECHNGSGNGRSTKGVPIPISFHNLASPEFQTCTICHVRIHGSNADAFFLR
jgi:DmsE family decaheme c-type cytochrome